jgi:hypothetical protein
VTPINIPALITTSTVLVCFAAHAQPSPSRSAANDSGTTNAAQAPVAASSGVNKSDRMEASTEVAAAAAAIVAAFGRNDSQAYFTCFAPEATFIFHTTPRRLNSRAEYQAESAKWVKENGFRVRSCKSTDSRVQVLGGGPFLPTRYKPSCPRSRATARCMSAKRSSLSAAIRIGSLCTNIYPLIPGKTPPPRNDFGQSSGDDADELDSRCNQRRLTTRCSQRLCGVAFPC